MKKIIHVDLDCFYAAVEVKHRPELKGKPLGIGGPANSRSVLCTASYEARKFGVRSAMPSSQAVRLCPDLILVPPRFDLYRRESRQVREIFHRFTEQVEPLSLDEAYLDVSHAESATRIAQDIRTAIHQELGLTASAGVAPNKFLAKIASDWRKPNGLFVIRPEEVEAFMPPLKIEKIWGVGKITAQKMHTLGLHTCADIQAQSLWQLTRWFGAARAKDLSDLARGIDHREVEPSRERKSLTVEETLGKDLPTLEECLARVSGLYQDWESRMRRIQSESHIRGHVVKLKFYDFKTTTCEIASTAWPSERDFVELLKTAWARQSKPVRLIGLGVRLANAQASAQLTLL